jgi:hypothetical protein
MPIAVLVLALVAYGYVLIAYPAVRRPALLGGALITATVAGTLRWEMTVAETRATAS